MSPVSRRTLTKGAAWSVPAVAFAAAAPATALPCPGTVATDVEEVFNRFKATMPDLSGVKLVVSYHSSSGANGFLTEHSIHLTNAGTKPLDAETFPLSIDLAFKAVDTSPAVNTTLSKIAGPAQTRDIPKPWNPASSRTNLSTPGPGNAATQVVGRCGEGVSRRDMSWGSSNMDVYNPVTRRLIKSKPTEVGEEYAVCLDDASGAYGYSLRLATSVQPGDWKNIIAIHARDGALGLKRIYVTAGTRVHGFFPPTWDDLVAYVKTQQPSMTDDEIDGCYFDAYVARVERWNQNREGLAGADIQVAGWSRFYDSSITDITGWYHPVGANEWTWANEVGNFSDGSWMTDGNVIENNTLRVTPAGGFTWTVDSVRGTTIGEAIPTIFRRDGII
ncbi:MAG: hypothetical protein SO046_05200 [Actinomyces urogenitalis]|uniref:hypothetical protein n=1 Tax=Actinomyces urogenitalis TaxID=103621 RepID=UPI002A828433|nr:hypothetical protein [Actinomyces urogenitalis]MDY3678598.1 hypothetical protein [Actinomyces urogenitalis]